jgi:hypothetical protein
MTEMLPLLLPLAPDWISSTANAIGTSNCIEYVCYIINPSSNYMCMVKMSQMRRCSTSMLPQMLPMSFDWFLYITTLIRALKHVYYITYWSYFCQNNCLQTSLPLTLGPNYG